MSPVYAIAYRDAGFATRRAAVAFWIRFLPHRTVSSGLGISLVLHVAVFVIIGTSLYVSGEDEAIECGSWRLRAVKSLRQPDIGT